MGNLILKGRPALGPAAEGHALVCPDSILGWAAVDYYTGEITEVGNSNRGKSIKNTVLVLPFCKGSLGWSDYFLACHIHKCGPVAYVFTKMDSKGGTTVALANVPCVADFAEDSDPCRMLKSGDYIRVDGIDGTVEVLKKAEEQ